MFLDPSIISFYSVLSRPFFILTQPELRGWVLNVLSLILSVALHPNLSHHLFYKSPTQISNPSFLILYLMKERISGHNSLPDPEKTDFLPFNHSKSLNSIKKSFYFYLVSNITYSPHQASKLLSLLKPSFHTLSR